MDSPEDLYDLLDIYAFSVSKVSCRLDKALQVLGNQIFVSHLYDFVKVLIHELGMQDIATGQNFNCFALLCWLHDLICYAG